MHTYFQKLGMIIYMYGKVYIYTYPFIHIIHGIVHMQRKIT